MPLPLSPIISQPLETVVEIFVVFEICNISKRCADLVIDRIKREVDRTHLEQQPLEFLTLGQRLLIDQLLRKIAFNYVFSPPLGSKDAVSTSKIITSTRYGRS